MIRVLLADDHHFIRNSLQTLLERTEDIEVVATASNGQEAVAQAHSHSPDVVVLDVSMPVMDGIEAARQIAQQQPDSKIVMISIYDTSPYVQSSLKAGASGYVLKDAAGSELPAAIRSVARGRRFYSQRIAEKARDIS
jgi:DNA-binding NarL/FixJ family response regulator